MTTATLDPAALRTLATEAIDEGVHVAQHAMKAVRRGIEDLADVPDEATHRIRRQPLASVGIAFGTGLLIGAIIGVGGCMAARRR